MPKSNIAGSRVVEADTSKSRQSNGSLKSLASQTVPTPINSGFIFSFMVRFKGTFSFTEKFLPMLKTPILPVARFSGAYFNRLR